MDVYSEYEKIEKHIQFSKDLHNINTKGKYILKIFENIKYVRKKRSGNSVFQKEVESIYNILVFLTNVKRFNKLRLYFCLQYYLDELLFKEVTNLDKFQIEDDEFLLADLYFNQNIWHQIDEDIEISDIKSNFSTKNNFTIEEVEYLRTFFNEYLIFIAKIRQYLEDLKDINYIKSKLSRIFNRISHKIDEASETLSPTR